VNQQRQAAFKPAESSGVWWLNPAAAFALPAVIAGFVAYSTDSTGYLYFWRTAKYFDLSCLGLMLAVVVVFVCGCLFGGARRYKRDCLAPTDWKTAVPWRSVRLVFEFSFLLTVSAYFIWFVVGIKNGLTPRVVLDIIRGSNDLNYNLRVDYLKTIPGITTATQFGIATIALGVPLGAATGWRAVRWKLVVLLALAFVRSLLNSERLALIELLVPLAVSLIWLRPVASRLYRLLIQAAPVLAASVLYLFFGASEYFRSWTTFYAGHVSSFWGFIGLRLMGYYATALNNGALLWKVNEPLSLHLPLATFNVIWRFPVIKDLLPGLFPALGLTSGTVQEVRYAALLTSSANPEFNNPSGIFGPIVDFGVAGGLLYWMFCGVICGYLYREFQQRRMTGIFLYPAIYIGLIEATRVLYWPDARFFPTIVLLLISVMFIFGNRLRPVASRRGVAAATMRA
jgi:hypothetical protein